ncbi:ATP-binding protein [Paenarthrobacter sp. RAF54_2]|uniref:ATP-binding protein n=1 Tax=Paenarthrobacter sp. RAF54_2 TaxID=3233061 RepID=UPI003F9D17E9
MNYVRLGYSIRIVGVSGSGKTTVLRGVMTRLKSAGFDVHHVCGLVTHRAIPFSGLIPIDLEIMAGRGGVVDRTNAFALRLARSGNDVLLADDIQFLDNESLAVLEAIRLRFEVPLVFRAAESPAFSEGVSAVLSQGRDLLLHLPSLQLEQVQALALKVLGHPSKRRRLYCFSPNRQAIHVSSSAWQKQRRLAAYSESQGASGAPRAVPCGMPIFGAPLSRCLWI